MKRTMSRLFAFLFAVMMMLWALPSQAMAAEIQPRQVQQPPKTMVAQMAAPGVMRSPVQEPPRSQMPVQPTEGVTPLADSFDCLLCWTCGGPAPFFSGIPRSPNAGGFSTFEWGTECGNTGPEPGAYPQWTSDQFPRLCCHD